MLVLYQVCLNFLSALIYVVFCNLLLSKFVVENVVLLPLNHLSGGIILEMHEVYKSVYNMCCDTYLHASPPINKHL